MIRSRIAALILSAAAVVGIVASAAAPSHTQATWADRVHIAATATAGTWSSGISCTALDYNHNEIACSISSITYEPWEPSSDTARHFWVNFDFGGKPARWVTFTADLSTAVHRQSGAAAPQWNWERATVRSIGAQFTPAAGWTCDDLPEVSGAAPQWAVNSYFVIDRDGATSNTLCGS